MMCSFCGKPGFDGGRDGRDAFLSVNRIFYGCPFPCPPVLTSFGGCPSFCFAVGCKNIYPLLHLLSVTTAAAGEIHSFARTPGVQTAPTETAFTVVMSTGGSLLFCVCVTITAVIAGNVGSKKFCNAVAVSTGGNNDCFASVSSGNNMA